MLKAPVPGPGTMTRQRVRTAVVPDIIIPVPPYVGGSTEFKAYQDPRVPKCRHCEITRKILDFPPEPEGQAARVNNTRYYVLPSGGSASCHDTYHYEVRVYCCSKCRCLGLINSGGWRVAAPRNDQGAKWLLLCSSSRKTSHRSLRSSGGHEIDCCRRRAGGIILVHRRQKLLVCRILCTLITYRQCRTEVLVPGAMFTPGAAFVRIG